MITLSSDFSDFYVIDAAFMHTLCLKSAFFGSALEEDMWTQTTDGKICGVIARCGGRLYIYSDGTDDAEIKSFANTVGYSEIFTSAKTAENMGLCVLREFSLLFKKSQGAATSSIPSSKELYEKLSFGADMGVSLPSFEEFAPDVSHRLRHGGGVAEVEDFGAGLAFTCPEGGIINGIAIEKSSRGKGLGSRLLSKLTNSISGDILVCADQNVTDFYIKNGFELLGMAVISR